MWGMHATFLVGSVLSFSLINQKHVYENIQKYNFACCLVS